jgi:Bifunctional DNA primase/polymerase, N-terminal
MMNPQNGNAPAGTEARPDTTAEQLRAQYIAAGWALCKIPLGEKGPTGFEATGWQLPHKAIRNAEAFGTEPSGTGLCHAWSGTCAFDIDDADKARAWLADHGIDLDALLLAEDAVQVRSGRDNRAKILYRLPATLNPLDLTLVQIKGELGEKEMILEFRCATEKGTTSQDVLPPSIHPVTGKPYTWLGDWRNLSVLPDELLTLWLGHIGIDKRTKGTGPGTSQEVVQFVQRLEEAGLKPYRVGKTVRSHCPHHGGISGTTLKVDEGDGGKVLAHCHAGCTFDQITSALRPASPKPPPKIAANDPVSRLPPFPVDLLQLPHGLGLLQSWILGYMAYPSEAMAGITAIATLAHFSMAHIKIDSEDGLGLNEQFLMLAPTGFGKENLRKPFAKIEAELSKLPPPPKGNLWLADLPKLQYSAPASQQGLHRLLEANRSQTFLADEFAEWLGHAASDGHKQQALGHIMQAYSKAFSTLAAPAVATNDEKKGYVPVVNPRVLIFATSTAERLLETMNASQADSGALNRFVTMVAEQERIPKRYNVTAAAFIPPSALIDMVAWIVALPHDTVVSFTDEARQYYEQHDSTVLEPLKHSDNRLAGRLNAQAFKMAALLALSDRRIVIDVCDLAIAYAIREGLYHRSAALIRDDGAISGMHTTGKAYEQLATAFTRHAELYTSNLPNWSRMYKSLSTGERASVVRSLIDDGHCSRKVDASNCLVSNIYLAKAA